MTSLQQSRTPSWRHGRARAARNGLTAAAAVAVSAALVACGGPTPPNAQSMPPSPAATQHAAPLPLPSADIVALADQMLLTAEGRSVFYASQPQLVDAEEITTACAGLADAGDGEGERFTGGCFTATGRDRSTDRIFIFRPPDDRLQESMVTVAAHELLHAVYARLDPGERARVDALVAEATALVPADDPVHEQISWSVGDHETNRHNEQFAYLGSQIALEGGFPELLEDVYALFFADRAALVETHRRAGAVVDDAIAAADAAWREVGARESENAQARAQLTADRGGYDAALAAYSADVERYNAMPPEERARWEVTLRPAGADPVTMSWEASLHYRRDELERFRGELESRTTALAAAEAAAASARASAEHLQADATALVQAANPNAVTAG